MIHEDPDDLGYWTKQRPQHGGYPGHVPDASVAACHRILGGTWVAAEIQQAAFLQHRGHAKEAEEHRRVAGYGGLPGSV